MPIGQREHRLAHQDEAHVAGKMTDYRDDGERCLLTIGPP
jgi:hypothetical protein